MSQNSPLYHCKGKLKRHVGAEKTNNISLHILKEEDKDKSCKTIQDCALCITDSRVQSLYSPHKFTTTLLHFYVFLWYQFIKHFR